MVPSSTPSLTLPPLTPTLKHAHRSASRRWGGQRSGIPSYLNWVSTFKKRVGAVGPPFRPACRSCLSVGGELEGARGQIGSHRIFTLTKFK